MMKIDATSLRIAVSLLALSLCVTRGFGQGSSTEPEATEIERRMNALYDGQDWAGVVGSAKELLSADPSRVYAYGKIGDALSRLKRPQDAIDAYQKYVESFPNDGFALSNIAQQYREMNRLGEAYAYHRLATQRDPENWYAWELLSQYYIWYDVDLDKGIDAANRAIEKSRLNWKPWPYHYMNRAQAYAKLGRYDEAISDYQYAEKLMAGYGFEKSQIDGARRQRIELDFARTKARYAAESPSFARAIPREGLDALLSWFSENPPSGDGANAPARKDRSAALDALSFGPSVQEWYDYRGKASARSALEKKYSILEYLRLAEEKAYREILGARVVGGVRVWRMYNMGLIVKTPDTCFAIDLIPLNRDFTKLVDFAIVSHNHGDHLSDEFIQSMLKAGKPCYSPFFGDTGVRATGGTAIRKDARIDRGSTVIEFKMAAQDTLPCLISMIRCGPSSGNVMIMHTGDANRLGDFPEGASPDFLDYHVRCGGYTADELIARVRPALVSMGHTMELGHTINDDRWLYGEAYQRIETAFASAPGQICALTWGESLFIARGSR